MPKIIMKPPVSEKLKVFVLSLIKDDEDKEVIGKTDLYYSDLQLLRNKGIIPEYGKVKSLFTVYGQPEEKLLELAKEDGCLLYTYWEDLEPKAEPKLALGCIIRMMLEDKKQDVSEFLEYINITYPRYLKMANGRKLEPYETIEKSAEFFRLTPCELIYKLKEKNPRLEVTKKIGRMFLEEREKMGFTQEKVAEILGLPVENYNSLENGWSKTSEAFIEKICKFYNLRFYSVIKMCVVSGICASQAYEKNGMIKTETDLPNLEKVLLKIAENKNILIEETGVTIEAHTFVTLVFLILTGCLQTKGGNKADVLYYLKNLHKSGNLSLNIINSAMEDENKPTITNETNAVDVIRNRMKRLNISFHEIAFLMGFTAGYMYTKTVNSSYSSILMIDDVYKILGLPTSYGIEDFIRRKNLNKNLLSLNPCISLKEVINEISKYNVWSIWKGEITSNEVESIFTEILSQNNSTKKYRNLTRLNLPQEFVHKS